MAAIITQEVFSSESSSTECSPELSLQGADREMLELIEFRYQCLWARVEMEAAFMLDDQVERRS